MGGLLLSLSFLLVSFFLLASFLLVSFFLLLALFLSAPAFLSLSSEEMTMASSWGEGGASAEALAGLAVVASDSERARLAAS